MKKVLIIMILFCGFISASSQTKGDVFFFLRAGYSPEDVGEARINDPGYIEYILGLECINFTSNRTFDVSSFNNDEMIENAANNGNLAELMISKGKTEYKRDDFYGNMYAREETSTSWGVTGYGWGGMPWYGWVTKKTGRKSYYILSNDKKTLTYIDEAGRKRYYTRVYEEDFRSKSLKQEGFYE